MQQLFTLAPGSGERRPLSLGGCAQTPSSPGSPTGLRATGDRIVGLVADTTPRNASPGPISLASVRGDGSDRRVLTRGTYRPPLGVGADAGRVAWWQHRCNGDDEIVIQPIADTASTSIASCRVDVLTRSARIRNDRIAVRLRCPAAVSYTHLTLPTICSV